MTRRGVLLINWSLRGRTAIRGPLIRSLLITSCIWALVGCGRTELVRYSLERPDASVDAGFDAGVRDAGFDAGIDAGFDAGCVDRPVPMTPAVPTVMFVIDRSGSMLQDLDGNEDAGMGRSRWEVLDRSLSAVLPPLDQQVAMGLLMFPQANTSCEVSATVDLSPALGNAAGLQSRMRASDVVGGTPTSVAVGVASQHLLSLTTATSARALVLATDGAPNCNFALDVDTCTCTSAPLSSPNCDGVTLCLDDLRTVASLQRAFQNNVPTYVIGLGSGLNQFRSTLDRMAVAGGVPRMGAGDRYYSASNQAELDDAFTRITAQLTKCTYLVTGLGINEPLTVRVDGQIIPEGPTGWDWSDRARGELVLHGMTCDRVAMMGSDADALVECP
ncbi:MAG: vWA domain-containing protein [Archangium sp.]